MKDDPCSLFQGLGYEEGIDPSEVPSFEPRKKRIDTHVIVNAVSRVERKTIFCEDEVLEFF